MKEGENLKMGNKKLYAVDIDKNHFIKTIKEHGWSIRKLGSKMDRGERTIRRYLDAGEMPFMLLNSISITTKIPINVLLNDEMSISKFFIQERSEDYLEQIVDYLNNQKFKFNNIDMVFDPNTVLDGVRRLGSIREQRCFYLRCEGKTPKFIGETFNVTEERINYILDKLKKKLEQNWKMYKTINIPIADIEKSIIYATTLIDTHI